jgi:hypothetical protein
VALAALLLALLAAIPASAPGAPPAAQKPAENRVVAIADIHGDLAAFTAMLQKAGLVDAANRWVAQDTTLVQTGDAIDRGPHSREVLDLLMELEKQASKKRSQVILLLGNHEVMNLTGDLRYVTPAEYGAFANANSEKRRTAAWKQFVNWKKARARALGQPEPVLGEQPDPAWLEAHPLGYFEHRDAYSPQGKYGKWLRPHDTVARVGTTLFVHGGISPNLPLDTIPEINERIRAEVRLFDSYVRSLTQQGLILPFLGMVEMHTAVNEELQAVQVALQAKATQAAAEGKIYEPSRREKEQVEFLSKFLGFPTWFAMHQDGPLWFRGYARWTEEEGPGLAEKLLAKFGVQSIVVGHSSLRSGRAWARFGGKIFLIDTGMLSTYYEGGRASALEIVGQTFTALYMDQRTVLHPAGAVPAGNKEDEDACDEEPGGGLAPSRPRQGAARANAEAGRPAASTVAWKGPGGTILPFRDDTEVLEFLRTAEVVSVNEVGTGVTKPKKVLLEKDGVRMHAIFRGHNSEKPEAQLRDGRRIRNYRDSYRLEVAAYHLAKLLGLDAIPPVVERRIEGKNGSVQVWIENAITETARLEKKIQPPDQRRWNQQTQMMRLFDLLVFNWDRHTDNILVDRDWNLWMVDHTRSFRREADLPYVDQIIICERTFWQRLQEVGDETIRQRLKDILYDSELKGLLKRRTKLVEYLRTRIASQGERSVLFSWPARG